MKIIKYIIPAVILVFMTSCSERILDQDTTSDSILTLTFKSSSLSTKVAGVESLNENKIESLHYFIYSVVDFDETTSTPIVSGVETGLNAQGQYGIQINLTGPELNDEVFPRPNNTCKVYAIANLPSNVKLPDNLTIKDLRAIAIEANFANMPQESFVMEGLGEARIKDRKEQLAAEGTIEILRVAAKLSLNINVDESVESNGITYYSSPGTMKVQLVYGVKNAKIGASPVSEPQYSEFSYRNVIANNSGYSCDPFYTYPSSWEIGDEYEPYLRIIVPWYTKVGSAGSEDYTPAECYYKVLLTGEEFKRNTWYDLTINLSVLGSFDPEEEKTIEVKDIVYYVANWSNGLNVETQIEGARYLIVEKDRYEIFNEDLINIKFTSSHNCIIENINCTRPDYTSETTIPNKSYSPNSGSLSDWINVNNSTKTITFHHELDNNINNAKTFDFAPYTYTFRIRHIDNQDFNKDITIIQYPAVYITAHYNNGGDNWNNKERGYVMVNTLYNNRTDYNNSGTNKWQTVEGFDSSSKNPNMYIVTTTVLDASLDYILCDSRESAYYSASQLGFTSVTDVKNRTLTYYYPTATDNEKYLSPKFRICSAYGQLGNNQLTLQQAKMRCAAYQEAGYPAGRWRLATTAELEYIGRLCANGALPMTLFGGSSYWSATGLYTISSGEVSQTTGNTGYMRCVYDDWRWGSEPAVELGSFTWGDEQIK